MTRYEKIVAILDASVGGATEPVNPPHFAFWRGVPRDVFVAKKIQGMQLITVGDGAGSTLIKALKGETPFGADVGNEEADFNRMPSGLDPVSNQDIAFIEKWIDDGCPEDEIATVAPLKWRKTNAPFASSRTDDIWFVDPQTGWAVNSDGNILRTTDGGESWVVQHTEPATYLRCVGFANANIGWVGSLRRSRRLFHTVDGGANWQLVSSLPVGAPVKICGMSVVNDRIVYCSGTNEPQDFPRMMKTVDGGNTWTAWDMSDHASILIDCYFVDALHGWVVGGKSDEPTPTTRGKVKPVVLETTDGGLTWTNRLAGREAEFPLGEWGWKIQFLNAQLGFVSLENFSDAAILKTTDGGQIWTRLKVNDPQGNANLEGVGFIDEQRGWVGGWGPGGFDGGGSPAGFSSATSDGGSTWTDANEIGLYLNRFRFFGRPVFVGYASGDTIYKYTTESATSPSAAIAVTREPAREILPERQIVGRGGWVSIPLCVPPGTKRLTLHAWDRFGGELGCLLDEIRPASGPRDFEWDCTNSSGDSVAPGDYIVRVIADDAVASSRVQIQPTRPAKGFAPKLRAAPPRFPKAVARRSRFATLTALVDAPQHDIEWLRDALQTAIQIELSTLPPYLTARWSTKSPGSSAAQTIKEISREEMLHMGLACNMLTAIGGVPLIADGSIVPTYPGPLPWGIRPGLKVTLRKLDLAQAGVFMEIEYPQHGPVGLVAAPTTIGEFYEAVLAAFRKLNPTLTIDRQIEGPLDLFMIDSLNSVERAIGMINLQGEGSNASPEEAPGKLAHYYQFGEIFNQKRFVKTDGHWDYTGSDLPLPEVYDVADIPAGGYLQQDVPDVAIWDLIDRFDRSYSQMLRLLQQAWVNGDVNTLWDSVGEMGQMQSIARALMTKPRPDGQGNYGPCFRYVP